MSRKKVNEKKLKKMIIIFIILLIILIALYFSNPVVIAQMKIRSINNSKLPDDMKIPEYINFVVGLNKKEILPESVIKYCNNFAENLIPKYYKKCSSMSSDEINKFFDRNKKIIETELGITEKEKFTGFISNLKNIKNDEFILDKYYILDNTVQNGKNNIIVYIGIKYSNNDDIYFRSIIEKEYQKNKTSVSFDSDTNSSKIEEGMKILHNREEEIKNTKSPFTRGAPVE